LLIHNIKLSLRIFALAASVLLALYALSYLAWYNRAPETTPIYGVNFSCKRAEYLGQDCARVFAEVLDGLGVRHLRVSVYWSDVEQELGVYTFTAIDQLLDAAAVRGARVTVSLGMKAQRFPEYWFPTWLRLQAKIAPGASPEEYPIVPEALLPYLAAAARHLGAHPAVEAIQVENEPFVSFHTYVNGWEIRPEFLLREIETVRAADPGHHPIVVSHASWLRRDDTWEWILDRADVLAQSVYTKRQRGPWPWLYIFPYRIGPLTPDLPVQARAARAQGKELWIGELQAEPFERADVDLRRIPTAAAASFSLRGFDQNVRFARRSGATRAYLWGVEWWAYLRDVRGEPALWEAARKLFDDAAVSGTPRGERR